MGHAEWVVLRQLAVPAPEQCSWAWGARGLGDCIHLTPAPLPPKPGSTWRVGTHRLQLCGEDTGFAHLMAYYWVWGRTAFVKFNYAHNLVELSFQ